MGELHARSGVGPALAPVHGADEHGEELDAGASHPVLVARRVLAVLDAANDPRADEGAQPRREHVTGGAGVAGETVEAVDAELTCARVGRTGGRGSRREQRSVALFLSALVIGVTLGTIYGLMAFGMVASYRISGVVNLGQAGVAALCASLYWRMEAVWAVPRPLAVPAALLLGAVLGAALGLVVLRLSTWAKGLVMILTLAITLLLLAASDLILPLNNPAGAPVFGSRGFDFQLTYVTADQIGSFVTCIVVALVTTLALRRTRFGLFVRVIYDEPDTAATLGIPLTAYVIRVWALAGSMAGLAGILVSTRTTLATPLLLFVMVWGLSGAVLGGLESFALAFAGGLVLGIAEGMIGSMLAGYLAPGLENLTAVVVMAVGVLWVGRRRRHLAHLQT